MFLPLGNCWAGAGGGHSWGRKEREIYCFILALIMAVEQLLLPQGAMGLRTWRQLFFILTILRKPKLFSLRGADNCS